MHSRIGISLGDCAGIGPEVTLKALTRLVGSGRSFLLIGDHRLLEELNTKLNLGLKLAAYHDANQPDPFCVYNSFPAAIPLSVEPGSSIAAQAAIAWLKEGAIRCMQGELDALVTAPVNKESIINLGEPFVGQTEYLTDIAQADRTVMMLLGPDDRQRWLRVALATTHLPLREVAAALTQDKVEIAIERAAASCRDLNLPRAKIGVCGLNPHAGEGGKLGNEEITIIRPAVEACIKRGIDVEGPFAADTLFHQVYHGSYDAVVAMYHDQGLAPLKMVAFDSGVNWTLGLSFIRTSPDHGTAYNIAGKGIANESSMVAAINLAIQLADRKRNR
ncbi:MAG: 4-hydroxythreonine-4-phosphate dehydrogenase PdxA [Verrucomicrobiales bacterium]